MNLKPQYKLNDLQNRPLVVLCSFLFSLVVYLVVDKERKETIYRDSEIKLRAKIDSINHEQIVLYRQMAFKDRVISEQERLLISTDSVFTKIKQSAKTILKQEFKPTKKNVGIN